MLNNNQQLLSPDDFKKSPLKLLTHVRNPFCTPQPRAAKVSPNKQCWTDSVRRVDAGRAILFGKRLSFEDPAPLIPSMVDKLKLDFERLKNLIASYQDASLLRSKRTNLDRRKSKLSSEISKVVNQIILVLTPVQIKELFPDNETTQLVIRCLNANASFHQRLRIIARVFDAGNPIEEKDNIWGAVKDYALIMQQLMFEQKLKLLDINFTPLIKLRRDDLVRTRIIFTDIARSDCGFKAIIEWADKFADMDFDCVERKVKIKQTGAKKICEDLQNKGLTCSDLEMAWGHLMNDGRHADDKIVIVGSLETLKHALSLCSEDSTFVLDGHGGGNQFSVGSSRLQGDDLRRFISKIVSMLDENISHVILSVCATGVLSLKESAVDISIQDTRRNKYNVDDAEIDPKSKHKNRKKIFVGSNNVGVDAMFENLSSGMQPLAAHFAKLILNRKNQSSTTGTAYTFSPSILYPADCDDGGVMCVPSSRSEPKYWPEYYDSWTNDDRQYVLIQKAFKSITLYNNENNSKALPRNGEWKKILPAL